MDNVDIASPEFKYLLKQAVLETLKEMIAESPQHTEISMLLLIHVRDMQTFKDKIESELQSIKQHLSRIDGRLDGIDGRLDGIDGRLDGIDGRLDSSENRLQKIEETMVTKDYLDKTLKNYMTREETLKTFMTREETLKTFMTKAELRSEFKDMVAQIGRTMRQMLDERDDRDKVKGQELFESKS